MFFSSSSFLLAQDRPPEEYVPLDLFQKIARADLTVHVRVLDGAGRLAIVAVLEVFRGTPPAEHLRIDFRDANLVLRGKEKMEFRNGEEDILFLEKPAWRKPSPRKADIMQIFHGRYGRLPLPPEGFGTTLEAVRSLAPIAGEAPADQSRSLRDLLGSKNPVLLRAALDEVRRLRSLDRSDLPILVRLLADDATAIRRGALGEIERLLAGPVGDLDLDRSRQALEAARERARNDPDEGVRAAAVRALGAWHAPGDVAEDLRALAEHDPSQKVRYEAQRLLFLDGE